MIVTLSPSKGQDFDTPAQTDLYTQPVALAKSRQLIKELRKLDPPALQKLMAISENIADLNVARYKSFKTPFSPANAKQAILAFKGDVYRGLDVAHYSKADFEFAQDHLRILSGLYGCLRPLDLIQPYRLEMKTRLANPEGDTLYQFWGDRITRELNKALKEQSEPVLVNLASNEYFKSVKPKLLDGRLLTVNFKEIKEGKARVIAVFAKRARGLMADYIIRNRVDRVEGIKDFSAEGYRFSVEASDDRQWAFSRPQP